MRKEKNENEQATLLKLFGNIIFFILLVFTVLGCLIAIDQPNMSEGGRYAIVIASLFWIILLRYFISITNTFAEMVQIHSEIRDELKNRK